MADLKHSRNDYIFCFSFCGKKEKLNQGNLINSTLFRFKTSPSYILYNL